jgi:uncharacterized damage-inducible protein DinB
MVRPFDQLSEQMAQSLEAASAAMPAFTPWRRRNRSRKTTAAAILTHPPNEMVAAEMIAAASDPNEIV